MRRNYDPNRPGLSKSSFFASSLESTGRLWYFSAELRPMPQLAQAPILQKSSWGDYHLLVFRAPEIAAEAKPGQFVMIRVNDAPYPLLRRPISLHAKEGDALAIFFKASGEGTTLLARKHEGETLDILGPLGRGFDLEIPLAGKRAFLVGGGRGIAPLLFLGRELAAKGQAVKVLYGGRTAADLPIRDRFENAGLEMRCSTDDGTFGYRGFVTSLLEAEIAECRPGALYVCGPDPMMRACAAIAAHHGLPAQISLEAIMGCGFGACWGCVHRIRQAGEAKWRKICEDGPVFPADEIVWDGEL
jgi:dihydroorotate dehydrogenase electron transfer subunit